MGFRSVSRPHSYRSPSQRRSSGAPTPDTVDAEHTTYAEPVSEGEGDEHMDIAPARDEGARTGLVDGQAADAIAFREKQLKERAQQPGPSRALSSERLPVVPAPPTTPAPRPPPRLRTLSIDPLVPSSTFDERFKDRLRAVKNAQDEVEVHTAETSPTGNENGDDRILTRDWHAPSGKRIAIPVRVEPKVYFATERTFLVRVYPSLVVLFPFTLYFSKLSELATLFHIHRHDCNNATKFHSTKRRTRAHQCCTVHVRRAALDRLFGWHFHLPRAAPAQTPRGGHVLRQVRPNRTLRTPARRLGDEPRVATY
jgi:hypothetical protein